MKISLWETLLSNIHSFFDLSSPHSFVLQPIWKAYQKIEEILNLLEPILHLIVHTNIPSNDMCFIGLEQLVDSINEYRSLLENWHPLASRAYSVIQAEALIIDVQAYVLEVVRQLTYSCQRLPAGLSSASLQLCIQKVNDAGYNSLEESISTLIREAIMDDEAVFGLNSERLPKIAHHLNIKSNHDVLVETVALEKLKSAKQTENSDVGYIEQLIALFTHMYDHLAMLKLKQSETYVSIPYEFCCPISFELMTDPVIVASGITYDRASIRKWLDLGLTMCPKTRQTLGHTYIIPNYTCKALILNWCKENDLKLPLQICLILLKKLVDDLKRDSVEEITKITGQLLQYAKQKIENRVLISDSGGINLLVTLLWSTDREIQENAVSTLLYLAIDQNNKIAISNVNPFEALIKVLKFGTSKAKENSAATLFCLSTIKENKRWIGQSGAIPFLVALLRNETPGVIKNVVILLFNLSICNENRVRIANGGAVKYLIKLVNDPVAGMIDKVVAVLESLSRVHEGRTAIGQAGGIPVLVNVLELGCARAKENAASSILQLCTTSSRYCKMVLKEGVVPPLVALSLCGTPRAQKKALALLCFFKSQGV